MAKHSRFVRPWYAGERTGLDGGHVGEDDDRLCRGAGEGLRALVHSVVDVLVLREAAVVQTAPRRRALLLDVVRR